MMMIMKTVTMKMMVAISMMLAISMMMVITMMMRVTMVMITMPGMVVPCITNTRVVRRSVQLSPLQGHLCGRSYDPSDVLSRSVLGKCVATRDEVVLRYLSKYVSITCSSSSSMVRNIIFPNEQINLYI